MRNYSIILLLCIAFAPLQAQMELNGQTMFGNEWIDFNKKYVKVQTLEEGMHIVSYNDLVSNGLSASQLVGSDLTMHCEGEEVPIYVTSNGSWSPTDFLIFYGQKNDGAMDAFMFEDAELEQMNPKVSIYSDEKNYYVSINPNSNNLRYTKQSNNVNSTSLIKENFYMDKIVETFYDDVWSPSAPTDGDLEFSKFIGMDGFASKMSTDHLMEVELVDIYDAGPDPSVRIRIGSNNSDHFIQLEVNSNPILNDNYEGSKVKEYEVDFEKVNLRDNTNYLRLRGLSTADNLSVAFYEFCYARTYNAYGKGTHFFYSGNDNLDEYVELPNYSATSRNYVFDLDNHNWIEPQMDGTTAKFIVPGGPEKSARLVITNASELKDPVSLESKSFVNIDDLNPEYLILTSELLNKEENGRNLISEYEDFRSSDLGGGYKVDVVNVEDIYEQFGFGIRNHSYSLKNFAQYILPRWSDHQMTCIIGKGLTFSNKYNNTIAQLIVPTYGKPGSDNLIFASPGKAYPNTAVGRIAAQNQKDIEIYLEKAKINAALKDVNNLSIEERIWLKNVLHLSGGDPKIQEEIYNHLNSMANTIETNKYGACVTTVRKNSSDPVTTALTEDILNTINNGVSLLTFFGHSSAGTFDFSVEDPSKYMNFGKHPVVLSMGCHSGDIHENFYSLSEDFILTEDLGAIAFIASAGNAYLDALAKTGYSFYDKIGAEFYGQPIGIAIKKVIEEEHKRLEGLYNNSAMTRPFYDSFADMMSLFEQNTLHGDPAVTFFSAEAPDYVVDFSSVTTMDVVGTTDEFIELSFQIRNLGAGIDTDSLNNYIVHNYGNDQSDTTYFKSFASKNKEDVVVRLPNPGRAALGKNAINIVLDYDEKVEEFPDPIAEENNDLKVAWAIADGYCFFIFDDSAQPISPTEFAIVGQQDINLMASSSNVLGDEAYFEMQIDTTEEFNSPLLVSEDVLSAPGLIQWQPDITYEEETVYYWRIKPKDNTQAIWNNSSFVYLEGEPGGWNQSHFYQYTKDTGKNAFIDSTSRDLTYVRTINDIIIENGVFPNKKPRIVYQNNPFQFIQFPEEIGSGLYLQTFDGQTGIAKVNDITTGGEFGSHIVAQWAGDDFICFPYKTNTKAERANVINFIENVVPEGDYIALFTIQRTDLGGIHYNPEEWAGDGAGGDPDLMSVLEKYGANQVRGLADDIVPYIFVFKKGDDSFTPLEVVSSSLSQEITADFKIDARWHEGELRSTTIGPAVSWDKLLWNIDEIDLQEDSYRLDIIGCDSNGEETVLHQNIDEFNFDLSDISATDFPELKLNLYTRDSLSRTSPQMEYWRVLYKEVPEAVLDVASRFEFESDTLFLGDKFKFSSIATNITNSDMDSLLVEFAVTDEKNNVIPMSKRVAPLKAYSSVDIDFEIETLNLLGMNGFRVEINPEADQQEQFYFNNLGLRNFLVIGDRGNPLLDVTFDGVRIMDGDLVAAKPTIAVILKDDNAFNPITDITNFDLALQILPDNQSNPIDLTSDDVTFFPGDSTNNFCARLEFTPELESGEYVLYVQGKDASGNLAGDNSMAVKFQVVLEAMVSNLLNYPNPFSTSTEFVFTLTGKEVPDVFTIQIFNMSGKVVKEISKEELGNIRLGVNRTDYKWNGTDDFGNKLANGVYLYRLITSEVDGEELKHINNSKIDSNFKKGFGKLVIMR